MGVLIYNGSLQQKCLFILVCVMHKQQSKQFGTWAQYSRSTTAGQANIGLQQATLVVLAHGRPLKQETTVVMSGENKHVMQFRASLRGLHQLLNKLGKHHQSLPILE